MCAFSGAQDIMYSPNEGCNPMEVKFYIDNYDTTTITTISWDFGNGTTSAMTNPDTVTYAEPGEFYIVAIIDGATTVQDTILVTEKVPATFMVDSIDILTYAFVPTAPIQTSNNFAYSWEYYRGSTQIRNKSVFVDMNTFDAAIDTFALPDTGIYRIVLRTRNMTPSPICVDTDTVVLRVLPPPAPEPEKFVPGNYFVPDAPGNQFYIIDPQDPGILLYFEVFTRTGVSLYKTESPVIHWDGRTNDGRMLNSGVYFFVLQPTQGDPDGFFKTSGFIHIFRNQ